MDLTPGTFCYHTPVLKYGYYFTFHPALQNAGWLIALDRLGYLLPCHVAY